MKPSTELELADQSQPLAQREKLPAPSAVEVMGLMHKMIEHGNGTPESVGALEKMTELYIKMQAIDAAKDFAQALKSFQSETCKIEALKVVENSAEKGGGVRYRFAAFEDIMDQVQPLADKFGFVISFDEGPSEPNRVVKLCKLMHVSGHSQTNRYSVPIGKGPPGCSETQSGGAAHTYAKRGALCDALNIRIEKDTDAGVTDNPISPQSAVEFMRRVRATGSDENEFLKFAKAITSPLPASASPEDVMLAYCRIPENMYVALDRALKKKEQTK